MLEYDRFIERKPILTIVTAAGPHCILVEPMPVALYDDTELMAVAPDGRYWTIHTRAAEATVTVLFPMVTDGFPDDIPEGSAIYLAPPPPARIDDAIRFIENEIEKRLTAKWIEMLEEEYGLRPNQARTPSGILSEGDDS